MADHRHAVTLGFPGSQEVFNANISYSSLTPIATNWFYSFVLQTLQIPYDYKQNFFDLPVKDSVLGRPLFYTKVAIKFQ